MVVFTCQHCGESLNKPKVQKHYDTKCRKNIPNLTCVDCLKDFRGEEYNAHTQCLTEFERYAAKGTVIKQPAGKQKQARYTEMIQGLLNSKNLTNVQRQLLQICAGHENVPRKLKKFQNFLNNVARNIKRTKVDEESVFQLIETAWKIENDRGSEFKNTDEIKNNVISNDDKLKSTITDKENITNGLNNNDSIMNNIPESKQTTNKKQKNELQTADDEKMQLEFTSEESKENIIGLSKKEIKKLKKREKYLTELEKLAENEENKDNEISYGDEFKESKKKSKKLKVCPKSSENGFSNENTESMEVVEETKPKKSKKHKMQNLPCEETSDGHNMDKCSEINKHVAEEDHAEIKSKNKQKKKKSKRNPTEFELNGNAESENTMEVSAPETNLKKNKKRKLEEASGETSDERKKTKITEDEEHNENQTSFDWTDVILRVLESRPDKELSIKRLGKKVIDEYQTVKPDHRSYEDLLAKFNKKVKKTKGVRVLKDKAKIIE